MARRGVSTPAYAYASNDPTRYIDSNGLRVVVPTNASPRLRGAITTLKGNPRRKFLWDLLDESNHEFNLVEARLGFTRGEPDRGETGGPGHQRGDKNQCSVDVRVDWSHLDSHNRMNPNDQQSDVNLLAHEVAHGLDYLNGLPADPSDEELADWVANWAVGL